MQWTVYIEVTERYFKKLLFACEKFSRGSRWPRRRKYFSLWTSCYRMDVIKKGVWIRLGREHALVVAKQFIPEVNCEIKLPRIQVGLQ